MQFIQSTVQQKTVLDKQFYFIITFSPLELGLKALHREPSNKYKTKAELIRDAQVNLFPKRDHIIKQAARLGLLAKQLITKELIELYYDIYNPAPTGTQRIILDTDSFTAPLVKPAVESPEPASPTPQQEGPVTQEPGTKPPATNPESTTQQQNSQRPQQYPEMQSQSEIAERQNLKETTSKAASFVAQRQQAYGQNYQDSQQISSPNQQIVTGQKKY